MTKRWICDFASAGSEASSRVHPGDAIGDQRIDLVMRGEIGVAGVGNAPPVGPAAGGGYVDVDQRADHVAPVAECHGFLDVGQELQLVFDQAAAR